MKQGRNGIDGIPGEKGEKVCFSRILQILLISFCLQGEPARVATVQGISGEKGTPGQNISLEKKNKVRMYIFIFLFSIGLPGLKGDRGEKGNK